MSTQNCSHGGGMGGDDSGGDDGGQGAHTPHVSAQYPSLSVPATRASQF